MAVLKVEDLKMHYKTKMGYVKAVDGISFELEAGESLGIVGESGCGKTSVSMTLLRILPETQNSKVGMYGLTIMVRWSTSLVCRKKKCVTIDGKVFQWSSKLQ